MPYLLIYIMSLFVYFFIKRNTASSEWSNPTTFLIEDRPSLLVKIYQWLFNVKIPEIVEIHLKYLEVINRSNKKIAKLLRYNEYLLIIGLLGTIINIAIMFVWHKYFHILSLLPLGFNLLFSILLYFFIGQLDLP